jgi:hypothetical protein
LLWSRRLLPLSLPYVSGGHQPSTLGINRLLDSKPCRPFWGCFLATRLRSGRRVVVVGGEYLLLLYVMTVFGLVLVAAARPIRYWIYDFTFCRQ